MTCQKKKLAARYLSPIGGFTLLEVLIALVVLSIGLLGIAALQGVGLRSSHGAYLTSQASLLAYDMADRVRANAADFAAAPAVDGVGALAVSGRLTNITCPENAATAPLLQADIDAWACAIEDLLPFGAGQIDRAIVGDVTRYTIEVTWEDLQPELVDGPWRYTLVIEL